MTEREALKLALEALEANQPINYCMNNNGEKFPMMQEDPFRFERNIKAITAIKEALSQQEPVRVMGFNCVCGRRMEVSAEQGVVPAPQPVIDKSAAVRIATSLGWEPKRKPLTDEEIMEMYNEPRSDAEMIAFARAIEAAHGIWPENSDCHGPDWTDRDGEYLK